MHDEGMCNLIAAVINLAKKDYRRALVNDAPASEYNSKVALECFFNSEWLQMLSMGRANPETLMAPAKAGDYRG
jgi:hypothetical protein